jgi:hypothetical protein
MRCDEAERWISMRVDNSLRVAGESLPPVQDEALRDHLQLCSACRTLLEREGERSMLLAEAISARGAIVAGGRAEEDLAAAIVAASGALASRGSVRPFPRGAFAFSLAAAAAVVAGAVWFFGPAEVPALGPEVIVEQNRLDSDVVPTAKGPMGRDVETDHWTYIIPVQDRTERPAAPWKVKLEREDTRYFHLATWPYR